MLSRILIKIFVYWKYANWEGQSKQQVGQSLTPQVAKNAHQSGKELKLVEEN